MKFVIGFGGGIFDSDIDKGVLQGEILMLILGELLIGHAVQREVCF
jgi:hypothetical protein